MRSEFEFIKNIKSRAFRPNALKSGVLLGIGDDCAVLRKDSEHDQLITVDMLVEDVDFRLGWATPEDIGHKALAVSLSDVAAMGGTPLHSLLSIGLPESLWKSDFGDRLIAEYSRLADSSGVELIGGDISRTPDKLVIDSIVLGEVPAGRAVLRSGAQVGDAVFVTGFLGGARAGLEILEREGAVPASDDVWKRELALRCLRPSARTGCGSALREAYGVTAMLDVSDGLVGDLLHICEASGVGMRLDAKSVPPDPRLTRAADHGELSASRVEGIEPSIFYALFGGEDFELAFTVPRRIADTLPDSLQDIPLHRIGVVTPTAQSITLTTSDGDISLPDLGFKHF